MLITPLISCKDADDIHYDALKKGVRHFKEEGGRDIVCKAVEEYGNARVIDTKLEMIKSLMENLKFTVEQAMDALMIPESERMILLQKLNG